MIVRRVTDLDEFNRVLRTPSIMAALAPDAAEVDGAAILEDPRNIVLAHGDAYALFAYCGCGIYDGHYCFLPTVRGAAALVAARLLINDLFTTYGASTIVGQTPRDNRAACVINARLGFTRHGMTTDVDGVEYVEYFMRRDQWETFSASAVASALPNKP